MRADNFQQKRADPRIVLQLVAIPIHLSGGPGRGDGEGAAEAANACLRTHGGFGFANAYDIERKFRETRLYQVAPISTNLILSYVAERVLGLPRSF
jgi:hypothetical protein